MTFDELCLLYENDNFSITTVKGGYGQPLTPVQYKTSIITYIHNNSFLGVENFTFYLGRPDRADSLYLILEYHLKPKQTETGLLPAKSFQLVVPQKTARKFFSYPNYRSTIANTRNEGSYSNFKFYYKGTPIDKVFQEDKLLKQMESLVAVNNFFIKTYGKQYGFLGDLMSAELDKSLLSQVRSNISQNIEDLGLTGVVGKIKDFLNKY